ncbi:RING-H2 finger protein ATL22-like [Actinidia eriantha]|uniref:RING-H2 finger protein ATL22-like n=1 Tax=Actinidia eriantha TaxID=165200 RepID=UPI00258E5F2C|nr:RING-H2 finger protein ATL22-like [Actinidia eriantha]
MAAFIFFMLFFSIFPNTEAVDTKCPQIKCTQDGPNILFPFSLQGLQPHNCSHPGFKLLCRANTTLIQFPSHRDLIVKSISYDTRKLSLLDPKNCVHEVFLNLNLSHTPFKYYYVVKNYTYLYCSSQLSPPFVQVPCLSGSQYHVYVVEPLQVVPVSCKLVKTVAIPFSYSIYLSDGSFGLGFTWDATGREDFVVEGGFCGSWLAKIFGVRGRKVLSILILIFMVATLVGAKNYCSKNALVEKLFRYLETFKHTKYFGANVKEVSYQIKTALGHGNYGNDDFKGVLETTCIDEKASISKFEPKLPN